MKLGLQLLLLLPAFWAAPLARADVLPGPPPTQNILLISDDCGFADSTLINALTCMGMNAITLCVSGYNQVCTHPLFADLSVYDQVWDVRFAGSTSATPNSDTIAPCEMAAYGTFLADGGGLFLNAENGAFQSRNISLTNFLNTYVSNAGTIGTIVTDCGTRWDAKLNPNPSVLLAADNFGSDPVVWTNFSAEIWCPGALPIDPNFIGSGLPVVVNGAGTSLPVDSHAYALAFGCGQIQPPRNAGKVFTYFDGYGTSIQLMGNTTCPPNNPGLYALLYNALDYLTPDPEEGPVKIASPNSGQPNDTFSYTFYWTNMGTQDTNLCVTDVIHGDLSLVSSVPPATFLGGNTYQWCFGTVNSCQTINVSASMRVNNNATPGTKPNTYTITRDAKPNLASNNAPYEVLPPGLAVLKSANPGTLSTNQTVTYTLNYSNPCVPPAPTVLASDNFNVNNGLAGWSHLGAGSAERFVEDGSAGAGTVAGAMAHNDCALQLAYNQDSLTMDGQVEFDYWGDDSRTLEGVVFRVQPGTRAHYFIEMNPGGAGTGTLTLKYNSGFDNTYEQPTIGTCTGVPLGNGGGTYTGTTNRYRVVFAGCNISVYVNGSGTPSCTFTSCTLSTPGYSGFRSSCGAILIDNYIASQQFNCTTMTATVLSDTIPANLTYVGCSSSCSTGGGLVSWNIGNLAPGASGSVTWWATVNSGVPNGTVIPNIAQIYSAQEGVYYSNNAPITITGQTSPTHTPTGTPSRTFSPTLSLTLTLTQSPTRTATPSPSATSSASPTRTGTMTDTPTRTATPTATGSITFTHSPTATPSATQTQTRTHSPTLTSSPTASPTRTATLTRTMSPTATDTWTPTHTASASVTYTPTGTRTDSATHSPTRTASPTPSDTRTATPSRTPSPTSTDTPTDSPTRTQTGEFTQTSTVTPTDTPTASPTFTDTPTATLTRTDTPTRTGSPTRTDSPTPTSTATESATLTATRTATDSRTPTATSSHSPTRTATPTHTPTLTDTPLFTSTSTATPSATRTHTPTLSPSASATSSSTGTPTPSHTPTPSPSATSSVSFTHSPTRSLTFSITPTPSPEPAIRVDIKVYNGAGELVAILYDDLGLMIRPAQLRVIQGNFAPDAGGLAVFKLMGPDLVLTWDGSNSVGQPVESGSYNLVAVIRDSFGRTETWRAALTVIRSDLDAVLEVFNSAGELVWWSPAGATATGLGLSGNTVLAGSPADAVKISYGRGASDFVMWNGTNLMGQPLHSGTYTVKLSQPIQGGGKNVFSAQVAVLDSGSPVFSALKAVPGLVLSGQSRVEFRLENALGLAHARGSVHNLAGERIAGFSLNAGQLVWDIAGGVSSGVYLVRVEAQDLSGRRQAQAVKIAVLR